MQTIHFEDCGQDFLSWVLDEEGQVIDCQPCQGWVWNGSIVDLESVEIGECPLVITQSDSQQRYLNYRVVKIEEEVQ